MQKPLWILLLILAASSVGYCIYYDIQLEKQYTGDLRNRVVGARLQKDGKPPYFYAWKSSDGMRYYDPHNFDSFKVSNITASPFLHQMLYPLADLPQRQISKIWLVIEYSLWLFITAIIFSFAKNNQQKLAVVFMAALFLYTAAWKNHIAMGQIYLLIPLFALLFYYFAREKEKVLFAVPAAACAAILILIRPTTVVFLLPFLVLLKGYSAKYLAFFFTAFILVLTIAFTAGKSTLYWKDYNSGLEQHVNRHQSLPSLMQEGEPDPQFKNWEGWDMKDAYRRSMSFGYPVNKEHGNFFIMINQVFHTKISLRLLSILTGISLLAITGLFFLQSRRAKPGIYSIAIFGCLAYMLVDFFSPIHRAGYNGVLWIFPVLLAASGYNKKYLWIYMLTVAGMLLNSAKISFMPMENTMGELIIFLSLFVFCCKYKPEPIS